MLLVNQLFVYNKDRKQERLNRLENELVLLKSPPEWIENEWESESNYQIAKIEDEITEIQDQLQRPLPALNKTEN